LVCCQTTKGNLNLLLHHKWAPLGVAHYLDMVAAGYFSASTIPLFRCTDACQFGLSGNARMISCGCLQDQPFERIKQA
jgi:cyclophilin family peptidyl-prolyl cis-trans isomerase